MTLLFKWKRLKKVLVDDQKQNKFKKIIVAVQEKKNKYQKLKENLSSSNLPNSK